MRNKRNRNIRHVSPQNKWQQIEASLQHCRDALEHALKASNNNWDNLQWPDGWSYEKYRQVRDYCLEKISAHRDGRMARIMGGQKQTEAFNAWLWEAIEILKDHNVNNHPD